MTDVIFADTSFLVAFYNRRDDYHQKARDFISELIDRGQNTQFLITDYIFDETLTTILNRSNKHLAIQAARKIFSSSFISIATVDPAIFSKSYELFIRYTDKEWSFTDCSSITFLREHFQNRSVQVATFDQHFAAAGFQTVPVM
jgi:hypothetical protein